MLCAINLHSNLCFVQFIHICILVWHVFKKDWSFIDKIKIITPHHREGLKIWELKLLARYALLTLVQHYLGGPWSTCENLKIISLLKKTGPNFCTHVNIMQARLAKFFISMLCHSKMQWQVLCEWRTRNNFKWFKNSYVVLKIFTPMSISIGQACMPHSWKGKGTKAFSPW